MHKKGASSLEFILAFMLFASFTFAAIYFFNPVNTLKNMDYSRDYTLNKIIENSSVELDSYSIVITEFADQKMKINISGINPNKNVSAVNYDGSIIDSSRAGNYFCIDRGNHDNRNFSTLYFSEDIVSSALLASCEPQVIFNPTPNHCDICESRNCPDCDNDVDRNTDRGQNCPQLPLVIDSLCGGITDASTTPEDYRIASVLTDKVISESRIEGLKYLYRVDYPSLKTQLGIPADVDFSFMLKFSATDNITAERNSANINRAIFSETVRREVLRTSGVPQFAELTVKVW